MQQINFLRTTPKKTDPLTFFIMSWTVIVCFASFILISLSLSLWHFKLKYELNNDLTSINEVEARYKREISENPLLASDIPIGQQVATLEQRYKEDKLKLEALKELTIRKGFSTYMNALSQAVPNTLWLTQIQIDHDGRDFVLNGFSISPDAVSNLLSNLQTTDAYKQAVFNLFFIKSLKHSAYAQFSIATSALGPEPETQVTNPVPNSKPKE